MNKKKTTTIISILTVVFIVIAGKSLLNKRKDEIQKQPIPKAVSVTVKVVKAKKGTLNSSSSYLAQLQADKSIKLSTKLAGFVKKVYVKESQEIKKDELLVEIDSTELNSNINSTKISLQALKKDYLVAKDIYKTNKKLFEVGGLSKEKLNLSKVALEMKEANLEATKQKLKSLQNQLTYLTIKAPFDGKIDKVFLHEGDLAMAGKPVVGMSDYHQKLIFSYAPTTNNIVKKGLNVFYHDKLIGKIVSIYNSSSNGLVTVEVNLTQKIDKPIGSSMDIKVVTDLKQGCILPDTTLLHKKDANYILVYKNNKFSPQKVDILLQNNNKVLISSCPNLPIASASETKLSSLLAYKKVNLLGTDDE